MGTHNHGKAVPNRKLVAVKIIVGQAVRAGCEDDYVEWQHQLTAQAARFPGYISSELHPPSPAQDDWTAVYQFDSMPNGQNWIDSATRQDMLDRAASLFAGPGTRQIVAEGNPAGDGLVSVVMTRSVSEDQVESFLAWQTQIADTQRRYTGFRGVEVFRPTDGGRNEWTICLKFDSAEHLDAWLTSDDRHRLLESGAWGDVKIRRIDHSYGNWFVLGDRASRPPSSLKTSLAVWVGLYPTAMLLTLVMKPLQLPLWIQLLSSNLISCFVMTYVTMPYYGNALVGWWLRPKPHAPQPKTNILGIAAILGLNALWAVVFFVVTTKVWHLG